MNKYLALIEDLVKQGVLRTPAVINAFKTIKREDFVLPTDVDQAYLNEPLPIGQGQTISQPLTVAIMLELLQAQPGERILDVGSGSGWSVALLTQIVGKAGQVYGIERIPELAAMAKTNVEKYGFISTGRAEVKLGDGTKGLPDLAPFDKIIVAAATSSVPRALKEQLKIGGRAVIPLGGEYFGQDMTVLTKLSDIEFREERHGGFVFVPLIQDN